MSADVGALGQRHNGLRLVNDGAIVAHFANVRDAVLIVEADQHVGLLLERVDLFGSDAQAGNALAEAADFGWVGIKRNDPITGTGQCATQNIAGGNGAFTSGTANGNLNIGLAHAYSQKGE